MKLVSQASINKFGDHPRTLRESCANAVYEFLENSSGYVNIMDIGAGSGLSAITVFDRFDDNLKDRVYFTLIDPSIDVVDVAEPLMKSHGIKCRTIRDFDINLLKYVEPGSQDVVMGVASIHHHAKIPFDVYYRILNKKYQ